MKFLMQNKGNMLHRVSPAKSAATLKANHTTITSNFTFVAWFTVKSAQWAFESEFSQALSIKYILHTAKRHRMRALIHKICKLVCIENVQWQTKSWFGWRSLENRTALFQSSLFRLSTAEALAILYDFLLTSRLFQVEINEQGKHLLQDLYRYIHILNTDKDGIHKIASCALLAWCASAQSCYQGKHASNSWKRIHNQESVSRGILDFNIKNTLVVPYNHLCARSGRIYIIPPWCGYVSATTTAICYTSYLKKYLRQTSQCCVIRGLRLSQKVKNAKTMWWSHRWTLFHLSGC